ncbi:dihydrofolate reductase [Sneathiella limimaris]|uniref:dihydrofolate reductase n=1 Tax=Sneathiella limimaris TaxID=1964213 RepID=UPI00146DA53D|nr:dihydrofolate reductase [Sneathiella limimaris]
MFKGNIVSAILAVSENNVIGSDGDLPWRLSNDLKWFKKNTLNKPMIMGRKTFQSLPGILPNRTHIILTRDPSFQGEGNPVATTMEQALEIAAKDANEKSVSEIMIIGGGEIYKLFADQIDRYYLTRVHTELDGDTFFGPLAEASWRETFQEVHRTSERDDFPHTFRILERKTE